MEYFEFEQETFQDYNIQIIKIYNLHQENLISQLLKVHLPNSSENLEEDGGAEVGVTSTVGTIAALFFSSTGVIVTALSNTREHSDFCSEDIPEM